MGIAITDAHRELEEVANAFLQERGARAANRALLDAAEEPLPAFWPELAKLGWLGIHLPEAHGGSGYGLEELVVIAEAMGRTVAPGPFVPTVVAAAIVAACAPDDAQASLLPALADGSEAAAFAFGDALTAGNGRATGTITAAIGGALADRFVAVAADDVVVFARDDAGVTVTVPDNVDPSRRSATVTLDAADVTVWPGAARRARAIARTIFAAEAAGLARECCDSASAYAKERQQFGRPIAMFQAVKHHCANMLVAAELATSATWDAARASSGDLDQFELASCVAGDLAFEAALGNSHLNIQVHGGIGFTWEHDGHLLMRRALALAAVFEADDAGTRLVDATRNGVVRAPGLSLPPEAEAIRDEVRAFAAATAALAADAQRDRLIETGYVMPHWPKPWGREASAIEQLVIDEEFAAAGVQRPQYGITGWVILTLIQHGTADQVARWVAPALNQDVIWCQLFSEPEAGSDAAGVKTRATRVDGGWVLNGQKVWTSGAHYAGLGLATVRTDPQAKKHQGITTVVIDMHAPGVEVRPLRQMTGQSDFNEVFFTDVFVPDDDVVGEVNAGWTVARATLGNERVSIGGGAGGGLGGMIDPVKLLDAHPERAAEVGPEVGHFLAVNQTLKLMNLRRAARGRGRGARPRGQRHQAGARRAGPRAREDRAGAERPLDGLPRRRGRDGCVPHPHDACDEHRGRHVGDHPQPDR